VLLDLDNLRGRELQWKSGLTDSAKFQAAVAELDRFDFLQIEGQRSTYDDLCGAYIGLRPSAARLAQFLVKSKATA